jgi:hypothetical protein
MKTEGLPFIIARLSPLNVDTASREATLAGAAEKSVYPIDPAERSSAAIGSEMERFVG